MTSLMRIAVVVLIVAFGGIACGASTRPRPVGISFYGTELTGENIDLRLEIAIDGRESCEVVSSFYQERLRLRQYVSNISDHKLSVYLYNIRVSQASRDTGELEAGKPSFTFGGGTYLIGDSIADRYDILPGQTIERRIDDDVLVALSEDSDSYLLRPGSYAFRVVERVEIQRGDAKSDLRVVVIPSGIVRLDIEASPQLRICS